MFFVFHASLHFRLFVVIYNMKLYFRNLQFEVTRRCGQDCKHCCRGTSQNIDLTKTTVDSFFDNNEIQGIQRLLFSGGEPTLNAKIIDYIVDKIIQKKIEVKVFDLTINGTVYSETLVKALRKLNTYIESLDQGKGRTHINMNMKRRGTLLFSNTEFHPDLNPQIIKQYSKEIFFAPPRPQKEKLSQILPWGRALENKIATEPQDIAKEMNVRKNFEIKNYKGENYLLFDFQYLCANGNVASSGCVSYDMMDKFHLGNVEANTIENMYCEENIMALEQKIEKYVAKQAKLAETENDPYPYKY